MMAPKKNGQSGFGVVELMVTLGLFSGLLAVFSMALEDSAQTQGTAMREAERQDNALKAIEAIRGWLGQTQIADGFPQVFDSNTVGLTHTHLGHPVAQAYPNIPQARELAFLTPQDADGDEWPDLDASGNIIWDAAPSGLSVQPDQSGVNRLYVTDGTGNRRSLARNVASVVIDDSTSSGLTIPLNAIRVRVYMVPGPDSQALAAPEVYEIQFGLTRKDSVAW